MKLLYFIYLVLFLLLSSACSQKSMYVSRGWQCSDLWIYNFSEKKNPDCLAGRALFTDYGRDTNCDEELQDSEIEKVYFICSEEYL